MKIVRFEILTLVLLAGCGGVSPSVSIPTTPTPQQPGTPAQQRPTAGVWQSFASEHIALWYHSLALTRAGVRQDLPVPLYRPGYVEEITAARKRLGRESTLSQQASDFAQKFRDDAAFSALQFLPLYFESAQALYAAVRTWDRLQGDPRGAGSQQASQPIAFLASQFPRATQRKIVVDFTQAVQDEQTAFYDAYWREQLPTIQQRVTAFRTEWNALYPSVSRFLDYVQLPSADVFVSPALAGEGRTITSGTTVPRIVATTGQNGEQVAFAVLHETVTSIAPDVVKDNFAPSEIRTIGEDVLAARVAVRGGAMLLARVAAARVPAYRQFYLQQVGSSGNSEAAFAQAFPLSPAVERALDKEIQSALAGF